MNKNNFAPYVHVIEKGEKQKKIKNIEIDVIANDYSGNFNITDIQVQEGEVKTHYHPSTKEFLDNLDFQVDEFHWMKTVSNAIKEGVQPRKLTGLKNRIYNIVGRGHDVMALPNVYDMDYTKSLVSTSLDLTIIPKNDYDLLRISTNEGFYDGSVYSDENFKDNPLNTRYSKEFFFKGGKKGDIIKLLGSKYMATVNDKPVPITRKKVVDDLDIHNVQRFMTTHFGNQRIRIEFYKKVPRTVYDETVYIYEDTGIGYNVFAEFKQYEKGKKY